MLNFTNKFDNKFDTILGQPVFLVLERLLTKTLYLLVFIRENWWVVMDSNHRPAD